MKKVFRKALTVLLVFALNFTLLPVSGLPVAAASNSAPTVSNTNVIFGSIPEDVTVSDNTIKTVSDLLDLAGAKDADGNTLGIAVTSVDDSNGTWELYYNSAWWSLTRYNDINTISDSNAYLIPNDCSIRFQPGADFNGQAFFTFRVWDGTSGTSDTTIDASGSNNGGSTSLSADKITASITVTAVNDAPEIHKKGSNNVLVFDGSNDFVSVPDLGLNDGSFTVEGWINAHGANTYSRFFDFGGGPDNNVLWAGFLGNSGQMAFETWSGTDRSQSSFIVTPSVFELNKWVYVTVVYNSANHTGYLYWNGDLKAFGTLATAAVPRAYDYFGRSNWTADQYFDGEMRDIAVWKAARTASEIVHDMNSMFSGSEDDLVLYYPLNDAADSSTIQSASGSHNGDLYNYSSSGSGANTEMITNVGSFDYNIAGFAGTTIPVDRMYLKDVDAGPGGVELTLSAATAGNLTLDVTEGLTLDGNGTSTLTAHGTVNDINTALQTLSYRSDIAGAFKISATVNDGGNTGSGGALSDSETIDVTVNAALDSSITPTITSQPSSVTVTAGQSAGFSITASAPTNGNDFTYQWQMSDNGGSSWSDISGATGSAFSIGGVTENENVNQYRCVLYDSADNTSVTSDKVTLTVNYPFLRSVTPSSGETGTAVDTQLNMTFSEDINATTTGSIYVAGPLGTAYTIPVNDSSHVNINKNAVTVTLPGSLDYITKYHILIDAGAFVDSSHNAYAGISDSKAWSFTTGVSPNLASPALTGVTPSSGETGVAVDTQLTMTFSEDINATTSGSIYVADLSATAFMIPANDSSHVNINKNTVTVTLPGSLDYATTYHILIDSGAFTDTSGNIYTGISDATAWSFSTVPPGYMVTYNYNYAGVSEPYTTGTAFSGSLITAPLAPARSGYVFDGWYKEIACTNAWDFASDTVTEATALYVKWTQSAFAVTYDGNGATSGSVPTDWNAYASGGTVTVKGNIGNLAKTGHAFSGWSTGSTTYTAGQTFAISADTTLSAVWTASAATYTVTYSYNSGAGTYTKQSNIAAGATLTSPATPTRASHTFIGWYKDAACVFPWSFTDEAVMANTTLYAKWAENTYSVSGTVQDDLSDNVSGATVKVNKGNNQVGTEATTDSNGEFTVSGVPDGVYNLVVTKGDQEITVCITVSGGDYTYTGFIVLPNGNKNSILDVLGSDTPPVVVDGLNDLFQDSSVFDNDISDTNSDASNVNNGCTVEIRLTVQPSTDTADQAKVQAAMSSGGYTCGTILDVDLTKTSTDKNGVVQAQTAITSTNTLLKLIIPLPAGLQGRSNYIVYRAHDYGGSIGLRADAITATANANGEYIEVSGDKTQITLYAKYFSTYAIAYSGNSRSSDNPTGGGSSLGMSYSITASTGGDGGSISPGGTVSVMKGGNKTFTITPDSGYINSGVMVDGVSVGAVSSYTFSNIAAVHAIKAVFAKADGLPYYLDASGNKVFLGFSSDVSGTMKYIAPDGKIILFAPNPKNFKDIGSHWAKSYIDFAAEREIFIDTGGGVFSPNTGMTRAMLATVIGRLYERCYGVLSTTGAHAFTDCDYSNWYGSYIDWCTENGIIHGVGDDMFQPDRQVTRQEMATMLYRFAEFMKADTMVEAGKNLRYPDASSIGSWAWAAALYCQETGIITGRDGGSFAPAETATRAEVTAILERFIEKIVK